MKTRAQILERKAVCRIISWRVWGADSNSMGLFAPFYDDTSVQFHGAEAAGEGVETGRHAASISMGTIGVFHGSREYLLQNADGQVQEAHSISAGLDYPVPVRSTVSFRPADGDIISRSPIKRRSTLRACCAEPRASFPLSKAPMPSLRCIAWSRRPNPARL
jgi:tryptophan synthase beta subunit